MSAPQRVRLEDLTPAQRRELKLQGAGRRRPGPAPAQRAPRTRNSGQVFVCLTCDHNATSWQAIERHARAEHPCARIEQRPA